MTVYWLTFRLHEDDISGRSYDKRYKALVDAVDKHSTQWWVEPTSFFVFESATMIGSIAAACKAAIAPTHDLVLIRAMDSKSAVIVGKPEDPEIFKLMPYLKKV
jgi:DNA-binding LacI/PurR family transcriptional regulator